MASRTWHQLNKDKVQNSRLKSRYGITMAEYDVMARLQAGVCAICHRPPNGERGQLQIDHDHETGRVRGLLCNHCNTGLGKFRDDPAQLRLAAAYLER